MKTKPLTFLLALTFLFLFSGFYVVIAEAHRNGCHRWHSCPSDSGSYICGDTGHCSQCPNNQFCENGKPVVRTSEPNNRNESIEPYLKGDSLNNFTPNYGDDFQDGVDAHKRKDYKTAYKLFLPLAEQGLALAQYNLGQMYFKGDEVPQDYKEAVKWWRLAAEQGLALAQYNLGQMYRNGQGVPQDYKEAVKWYRLSAEQGLAQAQYNLGVIYGKGQGIPQDDVLAHMWFNLSSSQGITTAIKNRNIIEKRMSKQQIEKAQELARNWKPSLANE